MRPSASFRSGRSLVCVEHVVDSRLYRSADTDALIARFPRLVGNRMLEGSAYKPLKKVGDVTSSRRHSRASANHLRRRRSLAHVRERRPRCHYEVLCNGERNDASPAFCQSVEEVLLPYRPDRAPS